MKNFLIILFVISSIIYDSSGKALAVCDCRCFPGICPGDAVIDTTRISTMITDFIKDYGIQLPKLGKETVTSIQTTATAVNTFKIMYDQTIRRPLKDAMTLMAIAKDSQQILNLVNGATGGDSLLIANPEQFVKNKELGVLRNSYNTIAANDGVYSESILNSIVQSARGSANTDLKTSLLSLNQSSIPSAVQNNICDDEELTAIAEDEVSNGGEDEYTEEELKEEKEYLYETLCASDPTQSPETAKKLIAFNKERPSSGKDPWDSFLRITSGDNEHAQTQQASTRIKQEAETKKDFAKQDIANGQGIRSATICTKYGEPGPNGEPGVCEEETVINPAGAIKDAFSKAKTAGLETAMNALGTGGDGGSLISDMSGILGLAGDAFNAFGQVSGAIGELTGAVNSVIGSVEGTAKQLEGSIDSLTGAKVTTAGPSIASLRTVSRPTSNTSSVTSRSYTQNLASNSSQKAELILPIQRVLNAHLTSINGLTKIDTDYIEQINYYKTLVEGVKSCYVDVENYARTYATSTPYANYTTPQSVLDFYAHEMRLSNDMIATLTNERDVTVPSAKKTVEDILAKVNASNSSEEITALMNFYQDTIDREGLPTATSNGVRNGEYQQYKGTVEIATIGEGTITVHREACASALASVKSAITERDRPVYYYGQ